MDQGKYRKRSSKINWTELEYNVQYSKYVSHTSVKMSCSTSQFHALSFCGVRGLRKYYNILLDPKLGNENCAIRRKPCACVCWDDIRTAIHEIRLIQIRNVDGLDKFKEWVFKLSCAAPGRSSYYLSTYPCFQLPCARIRNPYQFTYTPYVFRSDAVLGVQHTTWWWWFFRPWIY